MGLHDFSPTRQTPLVPLDPVVPLDPEAPPASVDAEHELTLVPELQATVPLAAVAQSQDVPRLQQ